MLQLSRGANGIEARATIINAGEGQFTLQAIWKLDPHWRSRSLDLAQTSRGAVTTLRIERGDRGWIVNDKVRPDLAACMEVDVSATPFCNGLAVHGLGHKPGELTALYVDAGDLSVQPSRQRYEHLNNRTWRYVDLGVAEGLEAVMRFDADTIVEQYEGLFARV